jgi:hypothetical protein
MRLGRYDRDDRVQFALEDLDQRQGAAAERLGYRRMLDGGWRMTYRADTPLLDEAWKNFQQYADAMVDQAVAQIPAPWADALDALCARTGHLDWWLTGSGALAVRGVPGVEPHDLDLVVSEGDAHRLGEALVDHLVEPVAPANGFSRWRGRAFLCHTRVEWVGGVQRVADAPMPTDFGPVAAASLEAVGWHRHEIRVPTLDLQRAASLRQGRHERVAAIDGHRRGVLPRG